MMHSTYSPIYLTTYHPLLLASLAQVPWRPSEQQREPAAQGIGQSLPPDLPLYPVPPWDQSQQPSFIRPWEYGALLLRGAKNVPYRLPVARKAVGGC